MAKSQHYDEEGLVDIFRQYGDHLYAKGDRFGAIEQYIKTIGKLEPSYIIRKVESILFTLFKYSIERKIKVIFSLWNQPTWNS